MVEMVMEIGTEKLGAEKLGAEKLGAEKLGAEKLGAEKLGADLFSLWTEPVQRENRSAPNFSAPISITISMNSLTRG